MENLNSTFPNHCEVIDVLISMHVNLLVVAAVDGMLDMMMIMVEERRNGSQIKFFISIRFDLNIDFFYIWNILTYDYVKKDGDCYKVWI